MGVCNSPEIVQGEMNKLFQGSEFIGVYFDDLLVLMTRDTNNHLTKLGTVIIKLKEKGLKINVEKSTFAQSEMDSLGFWVTHEGVRPTGKKLKPYYIWILQGIERRFVHLLEHRLQA